MSDHSQSSRQNFLKLAAAASASSYLLGIQHMATSTPNPTQADLILINGRIATQDERRSFVDAITIRPVAL